ncbi:MAG: twitching motility protein PilT [Patescibacteria group bacterium]|jgi:twitching motility protein PilT|nr:twitching motility protein PilT [Patescibacteria group bacterium]
MASDYKKELDNLVSIVLKESASDLHLAEGRQPTIRVSSFLVPLVKEPVLTRTDIKGLLDELLEPQKKELFLENKEIDFAYDHEGSARFRGNAFFQLGKISIALRLIPKKIKTLEELGLPSILESFTNKQQGFFLVVGPTGQGKSTTLAAMLDMINERRLEHVITIEDPIEYIFEPKKAIIDQREVYEDTKDFDIALKSMFREDIDVVMIGEMRSPETMATAVTAAETGHLVFSTLHTNNASQTIARIIDSFPAEQQGQIRVQLSASLLGIFSQRLIPRIAGGLVPACELLINNNAVANLIRENRTHEINTVIETGADQGMIDLNRYLSELVRAGEITRENAYLHSTNPKGLDKMI